MEKIKILFVIDHLGKGGAERQLLYLVNNIDREKFKPHIFITERKGERFSELKSDVEIYGLINSTRRQTVKTLRSLRRVLSDVKPHIIQTWL